MSHETSASDIEFAQGMLKAGCSDAEVLASLSSRGIEPAKAAELLDEVRHDRTPSRDGTEAPGRSGSHHRHRRRRVSSHAHGRLESPSKQPYGLMACANSTAVSPGKPDAPTPAGQST